MSAVQIPVQPARLLTGAQVGIPPRHMNFSFPESAERYFAFGGNALASLVFVVFSGIFPPGERFFMESVRHFRTRISDDRLKAEVSGFMGQEALHGREHDKLNDYFRARGLDVDTPDRCVKFGLRQLERLPPRLQLACTTMMEHFTAHLAEQWLTHKEFAATSDPEMLKLWYWHALEEMEHKAVAYDVFEQMGGTLAERRLALALVLMALLPPILASWGVLIIKEGKLTSWRENARGLRMLFGRGGFLTRVFAEMPSYLRQGFHPDQQQTGELEALWRERLFGEGGVLTAEFGNRAAVA